MVGRFIRGVLVLTAIFIFAGFGAIVLFADADLPDAELASKYAQSPSQFVTLPSGARVHYRDQGQRNGPALVLLHGSSASLYAWEPWVAQMGDQFRMVSLDLPAHGLNAQRLGREREKASGEHRETGEEFSQPRHCGGTAAGLKQKETQRNIVHSPASGRIGP